MSEALEYVQFVFLVVQLGTSYAGFAMSQYPEELGASFNSFRLSVVSSALFLLFGARGLLEEPAGMSGFWTTLVSVSVLVCLLSLLGVAATGRRLRSELVRELMEK
jgi:hypothetical protein